MLPGVCSSHRPPSVLSAQAGEEAVEATAAEGKPPLPLSKWNRQSSQRRSRRSGYLRTDEDEVKQSV